MKPESDAFHPSNASLDRAVLAAWLESLPKDPDLGKDIRMMVPIFYDIDRHKTKVWAVLGIASKPLNVSYATSTHRERNQRARRHPVNPGDAGPGIRIVKTPNSLTSFRRRFTSTTCSTGRSFASFATRRKPLRPSLRASSRTRKAGTAMPRRSADLEVGTPSACHGHPGHAPSRAGCPWHVPVPTSRSALHSPVILEGCGVP